MDVHFSNAIFTSMYSAMPKVKEGLNITGNVRMVEGYYGRLLRSLFTKTREESFLKTIKGEYLIYSMCSSSFDYNVLTYALNNGVSIVAGGTEIILNDFEYVRNMFRKYGTKEKNLKNLMLIDGYITPHTKLKPYIEKWKDVVIQDEKLEDIMFAKKDYTRFPEMMQIKNILSKADDFAFKLFIWPECVGVIFNSKCYWGKCKFCTYCMMPNYNFIKNLTAQEVIDAIMGICEENNIYVAAIQDDYFMLDEKTTKIVDGLRANGVKLIGQTGIHLLKNEKYARKFLDSFYIFSVGLEWTTDEVLKKVNKGYEWKDILIAYDNIKKYYNDNIITNNIIVDLPIGKAEDATLHYQRLVELKKDMENNNILWSYTISMLTLYFKQNFDILKATGNITEPVDGKLSGRIGMLKELEKHMEIPSFIYNDGIPYTRIDDNGNILESDIHLVDPKLFEETINQNLFWERLNRKRANENCSYDN